MTTDKKEDPIEILVIDKDNISAALAYIFFGKLLDNHKRISTFDSAADGLKYLDGNKDKPPKIILLETVTPDGYDFSFLDKYHLLQRKDFVYIVSNSINKLAIEKCLSYTFIRKHIAKPINLEKVTNIVEEVKLVLKKDEDSGV